MPVYEQFSQRCSSSGKVERFEFGSGGFVAEQDARLAYSLCSDGFKHELIRYFDEELSGIKICSAKYGAVKKPLGDSHICAWSLFAEVYLCRGECGASLRDIEQFGDTERHSAILPTGTLKHMVQK